MTSTDHLLIYVSSLPCDAEFRFEVDRQIALSGALGCGLAWQSDFAEYDWALVKRQIEQADAFLLLLGEEYGPTTPTGISFQHRELVHAQSLHKPVYYMMHTSMDGHEAADIRLNELRQQVRAQVSGKIWHLKDELTVHVKTLLKNWKRDVQSLRMMGAPPAVPARAVAPVISSKIALKAVPPREQIELITQGNVYKGGNLAPKVVKIPMKTDRIWRSIQPLLRLGTSEDRLRSHMEQVITGEVKNRLLSDNPGSHAVDGVRIERNQFRNILDGWATGGFVLNKAQGARTIWSLPD